MRTRRVAAFAVRLLMVALALNVLAWGADRQSGTWKMNPDKSKYSPGPGPKSSTVTLDSDGTNMKYTSDGVDGAGNPIHVRFSAKYDGKDYPASGISYADTVALRRIDANTIEFIMKKSGDTVMTARSAVSQDGKTRTVTYRGTDAQGRKVANVLVYDKQ